MISPKFAGDADSFAPQFGTVESTRDGPAKVCEAVRVREPTGSTPAGARCNITFLHFYAGVVQR